MPLRPAKFSEHTALAEICSAAFFEEHLFGQTMHPNRHEHPEGLALYFHSFIRELWVDWRTKIIAAVAKDKMHDGKEKLVGVAIWQRQGEGGKKMEPSALDPRKLLTPLIRLSSLLNSYTYPNHALDPTKANILHGSMPYSAHHWSGARQEGWYLDLLAVHPDYHGSGYGRELAQWGLKQAEKENVHASVMCSDGSEHFYLKCGFDEIVGNGCEGEGNPLNGVKGGAILFKYPKRVGQ